jgi:hypothetical protein
MYPGYEIDATFLHSLKSVRAAPPDSQSTDTKQHSLLIGEERRRCPRQHQLSLLLNQLGPLQHVKRISKAAANFHPQEPIKIRRRCIS